MKTIILLILILLPITAHAQLIDFSYTGNVAEAINGYNMWFPYGQNYKGGPSFNTLFAGPGGYDLYGAAEQFIISEPTNISDLSLTAYMYTAGDTKFNYEIYSDTTYVLQGQQQSHPLPLVSSLMAQSDPLYADFSYDEWLKNPSKSMNFNLPFNVFLQPGDYWLVERGEGGAAMSTSQQYIDPPYKPTAVTPEPATIALLGGGLLFALKRKGITQIL